MTLISLRSDKNNYHHIESQSHRTENWIGKEYIEVPDCLEEIALSCDGYCNLNIRDGILVGITPVEKPPAPVPPPTEMEKLRADVDFLAAMGGVEL